MPWEMTSMLGKRVKKIAGTDLKCWGAWDITCGHKAKATTPLTAWRRVAQKDDLPWQDEKGRSSSVRHWNCFKGCLRETSEMVCSVYGLFQAHRIRFFHLEETKLNVSQWENEETAKNKQNTANTTWLWQVLLILEDYGLLLYSNSWV